MRTDRRRGAPAIVIAALICAWSAGLAGCPGTLDDKQRFFTGSGGAADCGDVPHDVFASKCGGSGCHGPTAPAQGLDLESDGVADRVVGKKATECAGILVDPGEPEASIVFRKMLPIGVPGCGEPMPYGRPTLSASELACVRAWIAEQVPALPDAGDSDAGDSDAEDGG